MPTRSSSRQPLIDFARKRGNKLGTTPRGAGQSPLAAAPCSLLVGSCCRPSEERA